MNTTNAQHFATEWVAAWNAHDLDTIMSHYADELEFYSPVIKQMGVNEAGVIKDKAALRSYFKAALEKFPDLHFELYHVLTGVHSLVLFYKSINDKYSADYMELNSDGKVVRVNAHYS